MDETPAPLPALPPLARLRATGPVIALGLAWDVQIVAALPADPCQ